MTILRAAAPPAFLFLCLLLGGSRQSAWMNGTLQLAAVLLVGWAVVSSDLRRMPLSARYLLALVIGALALVVLQLLPLPPRLWTGLPGREAVAAGYESLGIDLPWLALSLSPYDTLNAGYALLPPIAIVAMAIAWTPRRENWVALAVVAGALASIMLGAVQVASSGSAEWAYLHEITNQGAVGFFANRNHMASLLLAAIPFAGALVASARPKVKSGSKAFAALAIGGGAFLLLVAGLLLNQSLAALALAIPVVGATMVLLPAGWRMRRLLLPAAAVALVAAMVILGSASIGATLAAESTTGLQFSRGPMWQATLRLIADSFPWGTGLGTFEPLFALREDAASVTRTFVNHAHNDYLELLLETGAAGLALTVLFLTWWGRHSLSIWRSPSSSHFARAATIASAALLAHSIVDYPLRTAAMSAVLAACVGLMAQSRAQRLDDRPRHVRIG